MTTSEFERLQRKLLALKFERIKKALGEAHSLENPVIQDLLKQAFKDLGFLNYILFCIDINKRYIPLD